MIIQEILREMDNFVRNLTVVLNERILYNQEGYLLICNERECCG